MRDIYLYIDRPITRSLVRELVQSDQSSGWCGNERGKISYIRNYQRTAIKDNGLQETSDRPSSQVLLI